MGVDGFRFDMAEMVPVEFWSYLNSSIKLKNPDAFLLAEVYNPREYRNYLHLGKMDYLYDKVEFYDTLKTVMQGTGSTDSLVAIQVGVADIEAHMLHFLENHDEQRIASPDFAGSAEKGKPAMVVSALISSSPTMIYFGQEVGEDGMLDSGFGDPTRTSIFDYAGVPAHQRWMNGGKFDGEHLSGRERALRDFYVRLLNFSANNPAMRGPYQELHNHNRATTAGYTNDVFAFARWSDAPQNAQKLIVISNFSATENRAFNLQIPNNLVKTWALTAGNYPLQEQLGEQKTLTLAVRQNHASVPVRLRPLESLVVTIGEPSP